MCFPIGHILISYHARCHEAMICTSYKTNLQLQLYLSALLNECNHVSWHRIRFSEGQQKEKSKEKKEPEPKSMTYALSRPFFSCCLSLERRCPTVYNQLLPAQKHYCAYTLVEVVYTIQAHATCYSPAEATTIHYQVPALRAWVLSGRSQWHTGVRHIRGDLTRSMTDSVACVAKTSW